MKEDMLSSLARGAEGHQLIEFFAANHIPDDWGKIDDYGVNGMVSGNKIENVAGNALMIDGHGGHRINPEYLVHLHGPSARCTVNLATVLAMAAAYCRREMSDAHEAMGGIRERAKKGKSNKRRSAK